MYILRATPSQLTQAEKRKSSNSNKKINRHKVFDYKGMFSAVCTQRKINKIDILIDVNKNYV
jgi:hypothetical protein